MALKFPGGAPSVDHKQLDDWIGPTVRAAAAAAGGSPGPVDVSDPYEVVMIGLSDLAAGKLFVAAHGGQWRHLVLSNGQPLGEVELHRSDIVALHKGPAKDGFLEALHVAEGLPGDHTVRVIKAPALRFIGLWLASAQGHSVIPFSPNQTGLVNLKVVDEAQAIAVLQPAAQEVQRAMAAAGGLPIGG